MPIPLIRLTLPCCSSSQEEQTKCSLITRATVVGIGTITLLIGILTLSGVSGLSHLGSAAGWSFLPIGILIFLAGICLRSIKENNIEVKEKPFDFAIITPKNYENYLALVGQHSLQVKRSPGHFLFKKEMYEEDFNDSSIKENHTKGGIYLSGWLFLGKSEGVHTGIDLEIRDDQFMYFPDNNGEPVTFSNLKEFFNYLFQVHGVTKNLKFFILTMADGKKMLYNNPYRS